MADVHAGFVPSQDESTAEITFYMKGADVAMATIVQYNDWLEEEVSCPVQNASTRLSGCDRPECTGSPVHTAVPGAH